MEFLREEKEKYKVETNALFKLEVGDKDKEKGEKYESLIQKTQEHQEVWRNDFQVN